MLRHLVVSCGLKALGVLGAVTKKPNPKNDYVFKIVLMSSAKVKRDHLCSRFAAQESKADTFDFSMASTIGFDYRLRKQTIDEGAPYLRGADAVVWVYDVTSPDSFDSVTECHREMLRHSIDKASNLLVGDVSNCEKPEDKKVMYDDAQAFANNYEIPFLETNPTSDLEKENIERALLTLGSKLIALRQLEADKKEKEALQQEKSVESGKQSLFGGLRNSLLGDKSDNSEADVVEVNVVKGFLPRVTFDPKNLTILKVNKKQWDGKHTDLDKYISYRIIMYNTMKVKNEKQLTIARNKFPDSDVVLHLERGVFKVGDLVPIKGLFCKIVDKFSDSEYLVEWTGHKLIFRESGLDFVEHCEKFEKVRGKRDHIKTTMIATTDSIFEESVIALQSWQLNSDGIVSFGSSMNDQPNLSVLSSQGSSSASTAYSSMGGHQSYILGKFLGQGAFGFVRLGYHKDRPGERYAIKRVQIINQRDQMYAQREADLMQKLNDKNVAKCFDAYVWENAFYLVLGYCNAGDLNEQLRSQKKRNKQWRNGDIKTCMHQIISGLNCLHSHRSNDFPGGILHRDLKPGNILVSKSPTGVLIFKITDFGLARVLEDTDAAAVTTVGTKIYMSPEVLDDETTYSFPNDIWALGCILYELCTFERAFKTEKKLWGMVHLEGEKLQSAIPTISNEAADDWTYRKDLSTVCAEILVKDVTQRPTCAELLEKVEALKDLPVLEEQHKDQYDKMTVVVKQ